MIFKLSNLPKFFFTYICPTFYGGSAPATPSTTTQNINSIPPELMPYVLGNLQAAKGQLFKTDESGQITGYQPYKPYSTDPNKYVAGFSALQKQAQQGAGALKMPGQFGTATGMATEAGQGALGVAGGAIGTGANAARAGEGAIGIGARAYGAGDEYNQMATDPGSMAGWMSPYMQNVTDYQTQQANRQYDISGAQQAGGAARAGAFGGSRDAIMAAENARNRNQAITGIQATGAQNAWQDARQAQQFGANLGMQGYQTGIQGIQAGMQGYQTELQGYDTALKGYQTGIQGSQQLGNLGTQQLAAQTDILGTKSKYGAEVQGRNQALIDQRIKNFENQQNQPYRAMDVMSGLVRGTPIAQSSSTQYAANPSYGQQIGSTIGALGSMYGAYKGKANGGIVQAYADGGSVEEGIEAKLRDMSPEQLRAHIPEITSQEELSIAKKILAEETMSQYARGGIVGYSGREGSLVKRNPAYYEDMGYSLEDLAAEAEKEKEKTSSAIEKFNKKYGKPKPIETVEPEYVQPKTIRPTLSENEALNVLKNQPKGIATIPGEDVVRSLKNEGILTKRGTSLQTVPGEEVVTPKKGLATIEGEGVSVDRTRLADRPTPKSGASKERLAWEKETVGSKGIIEEPAIPTAKRMVVNKLGGTALDSQSVKEVANLLANTPKEKWKNPELQSVLQKAFPAPEGFKPYAWTKEIANALGEFVTGPTYAKDISKESAPTGIVSAQKEMVPPLASTANLPGSIIEGEANKINLANSAEATGIKAAQEGKVYDQEISKVYREKGLDLPVQSTAYQPTEEAAQPAMQQAPVDDGLSEERVTVGKTPLQIMQERQAEMEKAGIRSSDQISAEQRKEIMAEKANAQDESKRQMYLRMAEFFSNWGSTPGLPLVAGLKAMKETLPSVMSDSKEDHAVMRSINKSLRDLEHATELEKAGKYNEAYAIKEQASERIRKHDEHVADLGARREELNKTLESAEKRTGMTTGASMAGHMMAANRASTKAEKGGITANQMGNFRVAAKKDAAKALENDDAYQDADSATKKTMLNSLAEENFKQYVQDFRTSASSVGQIGSPKIESDADRAARVAAYKAKHGV